MPKGIKSCPVCKLEVGARTHVCECGHEFASAINTEESHEDDRQCGFAGQYVIYTPAGKCPVAFTGDLRQWAESVQGHAKSGTSFAPEALKYWLRLQVDRTTYRELAPQLVVPE